MAKLIERQWVPASSALFQGKRTITVFDIYKNLISSCFKNGAHYPPDWCLPPITVTDVRGFFFLLVFDAL